eukprot:gene20795-22833_t
MTENTISDIQESAVSSILRETFEAIWDVLHPKYLTYPKDSNDWRYLAKEFAEQWNFPNCLGAVDGKHVMIECPHNADSATFNYKKFHSIVLMAICDAIYCFTFLNIGSYGSDNDSNAFAKSNFGKVFAKFPTCLGMPAEIKVGDKLLPHVLIGDDMFPLKPWLMKPFPGKKLAEDERAYNYCLSRARRTIENRFGILSAMWRIFRRPIKAEEDLVDKITKACVALHNYLRLAENSSYISSGFVDKEDESGNITPGTWHGIVKND